MILQTSVCLLALACLSVSSLPIDKEKIRFKLSAKGLPDKDDGFGTIDPFVEIYATQSGSNSEVKIGKTDTINDNENPDWGKVFEFDFDRSKNQQWHFKVFDYDPISNDKAGEAWVNVADFVDKGYFTNVNIVKYGYLTIKAADPRPAPSSGVPGTLPLAPGTPDSMVLKFKLSAKDLKDKDDLGVTDPYVEFFVTEGLTGKEVKVGRTATISNNRNPNWGETFEFRWDRKKEQRFHFKVYDDDNAREDDNVGRGWIELNDYVSKGQVITLNLVKKGTLTMTRADGLPPNPYNPATAGASATPAPVRGPSPVKGPAPAVLPTPRVPSKGPAPAVLPPVAPPHPQHGHNTKNVDQPVRIRFKMSASKLPDKDIIGTSDPYVRVYISQDGLTETLLKKGSTKIDDENPNWPDIVEFNYDKNKHPKLRFLVLDEDDNSRDAEIGNVSLDATEIATKNSVDLKLPEGTLTLTRV